MISNFTISVFSNEIAFGSSAKQHINLYGSTFGVGIQTNTQYCRSAFGYAWFKGGIHSNAVNDPGSGGALIMDLNSSGNLTTSGTVTATNFIIG